MKKFNSATLFITILFLILVIFLAVFIIVYKDIYSSKGLNSLKKSDDKLESTQINPSIDNSTNKKITNLNILNKYSTFSIEQIEAWLLSRGANKLFIENLENFYNISKKEGIDPVIPIVQAALETNFMNFGGVLDASYHNSCGLKIRDAKGDKPSDHAIFKDWKEGITAHIQHLALYAGAENYPLKENIIDTRHFPFLYKTAETVIDLNGKWAPSKQYGIKIIELINEIYNLNLLNPKG